MLNLARLETFVLRCPIDTPVQTSFGIMRDRPAVFVRVSDTEGAQGWGEVWCNFPTVGAEHRAHRGCRWDTAVVPPGFDGAEWIPRTDGRSYGTAELRSGR